MEMDFCIRRTQAGTEAIASGDLDRKSLNLLRMADEAVQISTFRRNLRNYGDVDALIDQLVAEGYMERAEAQQEKPGLFQRLLGRRKGMGAAVASAATVEDAKPAVIDATEAAQTAKGTEPPRDDAAQALKPAASEQGFGDLPLMSVNEGLPTEGDRSSEAAAVAAEAGDPKSGGEWQREAMTEAEADLISRYTSLLDREA